MSGVLHWQPDAPSALLMSITTSVMLKALMSANESAVWSIYGAVPQGVLKRVTL